MSYAVEAEVWELFHNNKLCEQIRVTLEEMGHPQQATSMYIDNSTVDGIINDTIQKKIIRGYAVLLGII